MKEVKITSEFIKGTVSVEEKNEYLKPWRLMLKEKILFHPKETLIPNAETTAGIRIEFMTNSKNVTLIVNSFPMERLFDITQDNKLLNTKNLPAHEEKITFSNLNEGTYEIWLSQSFPTEIKGFIIDDNSYIKPLENKKLKWITYGSSITHCHAAYSPARTWPAIVARNLNLNLTCLGYGGDCHLDPIIAFTIKELPADIITLKIGINIYGQASLNRRSFQSALIGFIKILEEKHSNIPIGIITPIISPLRENTPNIVDLTLEEIREEIKSAYEKLISCGYDNLKLYNGLEIFGKNEINHLPDNLHPDGKGYEILGENMTKVLSNMLQK